MVPAALLLLLLVVLVLAAAVPATGAPSRWHPSRPCQRAKQCAWVTAGGAPKTENKGPAPERAHPLAETSNLNKKNIHILKRARNRPRHKPTFHLYLRTVPPSEAATDLRRMPPPTSRRLFEARRGGGRGGAGGDHGGHGCIGGGGRQVPEPRQDCGDVGARARGWSHTYPGAS